MTRYFVDASVFITLAEIGRLDTLEELDGRTYVPQAVADEVKNDPAASALDDAVNREVVWIKNTDEVEATGSENELVRRAESHLGGQRGDPLSGDVALLAFGLGADNPIVVTDDKPLRKACKALGVPVSGSIGVLIVAVEHKALDPDEAKDALVAMDEVGAHLGARLFRRAERLIDEAAER